MALTAGGLPYPVGTDFVVDGDNAIRALAEAIDLQRKPVVCPVVLGPYYKIHVGWEPLVLERIPASFRRHLHGTITLNQPVNFSGNTEYTLATITNASDRPVKGVHRQVTLSPLHSAGVTQNAWCTIQPNGNLTFSLAQNGSYSTETLLLSFDAEYDAVTATGLIAQGRAGIDNALPDEIEPAPELGPNVTPPGTEPGGTPMTEGEPA